MGASVRVAGRRPAVTARIPCPCCGQLRAVINGAYLRWRRERAQLDQRTLATRLGVSGPYLSDLERNRRDIPARVLRAYQTLRPRRR